VTASSETAAVAAEIKALRKGRGAGASDLDGRLGPLLRELTVAADRDPAEVRLALVGELIAHAERLPAELRTAIMASLGLSAATRSMPFFGDRVSWLAAQLDRDRRTALRRVDEAERLLAEEIATELRRRRGQPVAAADGWYVEAFSAVLLLDGEAPEAVERRRIVATRPDLDQITTSLDVPADPGQQRMSLDAKVTSGGELVRADEPSRSRTQFLIKLPEPLQPGQAHEYEISIRAPSGERMRPYYIFTPERRCDSFELRVRFDRRRLPAWVRRVDGEPVRVFEEVRPGGERVAVDATGEACARFASPVMHLGYGLQWGPSPLGKGSVPPLH
jgi:hypothetical protein